MNEKKIHEILKELLKKPREFKELSYIPNPNQEKDAFSDLDDKQLTKENVLENIKNSNFKENLKDLTNDEIYSIISEFNKEISSLKNWLINSEVREKSFYQLHELGTTTATEIGKEISKDPKSVSTYLNEFKIKKWVEEPEKVGKEVRYSLSEMGLSFFELASKEGWFRRIIPEIPFIEETIIKVYFLKFIPSDDAPDKSPYETRIDYAIELGDRYDFGNPDGDEPSVEFLINEIENIVQIISNKLRIGLKLPKINVLSQYGLISIDSTNEDILALIFAAFNYMEKNKIRKGYYWELSSIKFVTAEKYFDVNMPEIDDDEGFMTSEELKTYREKILNKFKDKIKELNVN